LLLEIGAEQLIDDGLHCDSSLVYFVFRGCRGPAVQARPGHASLQSRVAALRSGPSMVLVSMHP
jgi:hypothetical protein